MSRTATCALCKTRALVERPHRRHAALPMDNLKLCQPCADHVLHRIRSYHAAPAGVDGSPPPPAPPVPQVAAHHAVHIARLVVLVELLAWRAREDVYAERLRGRIRLDANADLYKTPADEDIGSGNGVDRRILSVAAVLLRSVGVALVDGTLQFPLHTITLPDDEKARTEVEYALLNCAVHLDVGSVWDAAFGMYPWGNDITATTVFECLFSLFGLKLVPEKRVRASRRRHYTATITLTRESVDALLNLAVKHAPPAICTVIRPLGDRFVNDAEVVREAAIASSAVPYAQLPPGVCTVCLNASDNARYPMPMYACAECDRNFCSICLERVLGPAEMLRAVGDAHNQFLCVLCRVTKSANAQIPHATNLHKQRMQRLSVIRKRHIAEIKAGAHTPGRKRIKVPFLVLSNKLAASVQMLPGKSNTPPMADVGFAKLCGDINNAVVMKWRRTGSVQTATSLAPDEPQPRARNGDTERRRVGVEYQLKKYPTTICFICNLPLGMRSDRAGDFDFTKACLTMDGECEGLLFCAHKECNVVVHKECVANKRGGGRGAGAGGEQWLCARHECATCGVFAVRSTCRTCTTAYCAAHQPPRHNVHIYSTEWIACEKCQPKLAAPRYPLEFRDKNKLRQPTTDPPQSYKDVFRADRLSAMQFIDACTQLKNNTDIRDVNHTKRAVNKLNVQLKNNLRCPPSASDRQL